MPYIDPIVMVLLALGLVACATGAWRLGARGHRWVATFFAAFYGLTLVVMLSAHSADVLYNAALRNRAMDGSVFGYNWRTYSLLLFGALLIRQGVLCLRAAPRVARGEAAARGDVLRAAGVVLALVLPLIPIHAFFGYLISGASALTLLVVALGASDASASLAPATLAPSAG